MLVYEVQIEKLGTLKLAHQKLDTYQLEGLVYLAIIIIIHYSMRSLLVYIGILNLAYHKQDIYQRIGLVYLAIIIDIHEFIDYDYKNI